MHPSNRDHKDMQKGGVPNISSEGLCQGGCQGQAEMDGCEWGGGEWAGHPCYRPIAFKVEARCVRLHLWTSEIRRSGEGFNETCANQE